MYSNRCFLPQQECKFVIQLIASIQKLLEFNLPIYGGLLSSHVYNVPSGNQSKATVSLEGFVAFTYYVTYREPYPLNTTKTITQLIRINSIWREIGFPDRQISS